MDTTSNSPELDAAVKDMLDVAMANFAPLVERSLNNALAAARKSTLGTLLVARNATISTRNDEIARLRAEVSTLKNDAPDAGYLEHLEKEVAAYRTFITSIDIRTKDAAPIDKEETKETIAHLRLNFGRV